MWIKMLLFCTLKAFERNKYDLSTILTAGFHLVFNYFSAFEKASKLGFTSQKKICFKKHVKNRLNPISFKI